MELELDVNRPKPVVVGGLDPQCLEIEIDGQVLANRDQLFREQRLLAVGLQRFAWTLLGERVCVSEDILDRSERGYQLLRRFLADSLHAGNVVGGISDHREKV